MSRPGSADQSRSLTQRNATPRGGPIHFGKYELLSRINIGGMAEIVKACDTSVPSRPLVAVKRILPHLCEDEQYTTMFLDESRVLARLDHPNIIHAFEIGELEGQPYIALEFIDGQDARTLFNRTHGRTERIPIAISCFIVASVCEGLHHAHEQTDGEGQQLGVVHRDVSLQNILLSYAGDVKITDFGIAVSSLNNARTEVGIVKGKFGYMSPEQIKGAPLDRRSDVFGAGICLYELLTGERLFTGDNDYKAIEKVRNVDIAPPSVLNRSIPSDLERIVMKALAKQPRDRHQSAAELGRDLMAFMAAARDRSGPEELGRYLREVFAEEYESEAESVTPIGSEPPLDEADEVTDSERFRAHGPEQGAATEDTVPGRLGAGERFEVSDAVSNGALDGSTGLTAFEHLDPISALNMASDADSDPESRSLPPPAPLPPLRTAAGPRPGNGSTLRPQGLLAAPDHPPGKSLSVPPIVPHPDSIPGNLYASEVFGASPTELRHGGHDAVPEPRPLNMDWDEHEPTTISRGFDNVQAPPDAFMPDDEVTRVRSDEHPRLGSAAQSGAFPPSLDLPASSLRSSYSPPGAAARSPLPSPLPLAAPTLTPPLFKVIGVVVGLLGLIVLALYWARDHGTGTLRLTTEPLDAVVTVNGRPVVATASPFVLSDLDSTIEHTVTVSKSGHQSWSTRLRVRSDQVLDLPPIRLEPDAPPPPSTAPPPPSAAFQAASDLAPAAKPARGSRTARPRATAPRREPRDLATAKARRDRVTQRSESVAAKPAATPKAAPAAASGGTGTLRINTRPWSRVVVDGRLIGNTPQMNIPLSPGSHTVNLVNPEFGISKSLTVQIKSGETVTRVLNLQ